jgi:hypothetical protein
LLHHPDSRIPIRIPRPGPGPVNYPPFLADAVVLASMKSMAQHFSDENVRKSVERGFSTALEAMQKRIGSDVTIRSE